jgi:hypothetical protein
LEKVSPWLGAVGETTPTSIIGKNFFSGPGLAASFDGIAATGVSCSDTTTLSAVAPSRSDPGGVHVKVTFPGNHTYELQWAFRYYYKTLAYGSPVTQTLGNGLRSTVLSDLDGDKKLDLVLVNQGGNELLVLKGKGDGTFQPPTTHSVGTAPNQVVVGDWNKDGKPDLAATNGGSGSVSILLSNGTGGFNTATSVSVGANPEYLLVGDWNADGNPDLALNYYANSTVTVLPGKGDGTFKTPVDSTNGVSGGRQLAAADFDKDNKLDLVVSSDTGNPVVLFGNGNGAFTNPLQLSLSSPGCGGVLSTDFNTDGKSDVLVVGTGTNAKVSFFPGTGTRAFLPIVETSIPTTTDHRHAEAMDLDKDSRPDLVFSSRAAAPGIVHVFRYIGSGKFESKLQLTTSPNPWGLAIGDA